MIKVILHRKEDDTRFHREFFSTPLFEIVDKVHEVQPTIELVKVTTYERSLWQLLHMLAKYSPEFLMRFLDQMELYYGCEKCRIDLKKFIEKGEKYDTMVEWMMNYHMHVDEVVKRKSYPDMKHDEYLDKENKLVFENLLYTLTLPKSMIESK